MNQAIERSRSMQIVLMMAFLVAGLLLPAPAWAIEKTATTNHTPDLVITIISKDGTLTAGKNQFCVEFQNRATLESVAVTNVSVDFRLLAGRIEEPPIRSALVQVTNGQYCGAVDLGKRYYDPSNYYVFVRYTEPTGRRRKQRLFVSIRSRARKR